MQYGKYPSLKCTLALMLLFCSCGTNAPYRVPGGNISIPGKSAIEIKKVSTLITLYNDHYAVQTDYLLFNSGEKINTQLFISSGHQGEYSECREIKAFVDTMEIKATPNTSPASNPGDLSIKITFAKNEEKKIRITYRRKFLVPSASEDSYYEILHHVDNSGFTTATGATSSITVDFNNFNLKSIAALLHRYDDGGKMNSFRLLDTDPGIHSIQGSKASLNIENTGQKFDVQIRFWTGIIRSCELSGWQEIQALMDGDKKTSFTIHPPGTLSCTVTPPNSCYKCVGISTDYHYLVKGIGIITGKTVDDTTVENGKSIKKLKIASDYFSKTGQIVSNDEFIWNLKNSVEMQYFYFPKPLPMRNIHVTVLDTYGGAYTNDNLSISEMKFILY